MELDLEIRQDTLIVRPQGELDLGVADLLRHTLEDYLNRYNVRHLVLNLSRVTFIDSSCLGVILGRYKRLAREGGKVSLVGLQPHVHRICELSGLFQVMGEYSTEEEAIARAG
ncbi:anti-anti-sigma regulatory factor, SpoIIAA [Desulfofundulus australicus DSM 11792]|uniref:Anti-sigma F factor antagonist n=1 Tax=Desulfofundulus australicus DSM 11792 TaxID=1121425 RepID=A0A1M5CID0_9FIRM|nr:MULTISPECIES: anti-sigma F factor antagonist [Desulfofundulus]MBE3584641.1 anti-sigma F factor antagonist [Thermoanaerobacter sp.]SHF54513.1 anti-anti-sigma regulatory factor, SpoIIAA [Desulfofundulus australicus DSM 11792]